jgi:hypothetical protein
MNLSLMRPVEMKIISEENSLKNIHRNLITAENKAELLDVKCSMSDEPVENGLFVFRIKSPDSKELIIEIYDEGRCELIAND